MAHPWIAEIDKLRTIVLDCGLTEEKKWGKPCFTADGKNIVVIQGFKAYLAVLFFKGYLLKDPDKVLVKTGPNTVVGRQIRFADAEDIEKKTTALKSLVRQAVEVEKSGAKAKPKKSTAKAKPKKSAVKPKAKKTTKPKAK